jgi:non-specific serine/threonine protein kinase/serine/threonine-protein kinase
MADPRWNRAKQVFHEALDKAGPERARFVAAACAGDAGLLAQVEGLLKAHDEAGAFLSSPTGGSDEAARTAAQLAASAPPEAPGTRIGSYKLLQVIGEGGFGVVYMAEQEHPIRRRVALKIIKLGMDTREVIARFEAERQALAMMDHPNIARVFEAGATESGRPYFVMELVQGVPITSYCDGTRLSTRERLDLFADVCKAIHHAHEKGLIHRDIKPSNVMVTLHDGIPVPKIIDFGVAKATNQRLTEKTLFTAYGQFVGTPAYMSPEQAEMSGLELDRRSDIYSLGVLLYELLTGTTPFEAEALR